MKTMEESARLEEDESSTPIDDENPQSSSMEDTTGTTKNTTSSSTNQNQSSSWESSYLSYLKAVRTLLSRVNWVLLWLSILAFSRKLKIVKKSRSTHVKSYFSTVNYKNKRNHFQIPKQYPVICLCRSLWICYGG